MTERQSPTISDQVERLVHSEAGKAVNSAQLQQMPAAANVRWGTVQAARFLGVFAFPRMSPGSKFETLPPLDSGL